MTCRFAIRTVLAFGAALAGVACAGTVHTGPVTPRYDLEVCRPESGLGRVVMSDSLATPIRLTQTPALRYPDELRAQGIAGEVRLSFVIDTLGRVVPRSIRILSSTRLEFENSAREMILGSRWTPGRVGEERVAVCAVNTFHYEP